MLLDVIIRRETHADYDAVRQVHLLAFESDVEAKLVDALRDAAAYIPELSLVAERDNAVVGHILFTRVHVESANGEMRPALALAPMAVLPAHQRQGIGSALVREGLAACVRFGEDVVIVVGHPEYYPRLGFAPAARFGIIAPFAVSDEAFMVIGLRPGALAGIQGTVRYPEAFGVT